jgi:hypothetical protein
MLVACAQGATGPREGPSPPDTRLTTRAYLFSGLINADTRPDGKEALVPIHRLPDNPSIERLRKQAKTLLQYVKAGVPEALGLVTEFHPRPPETLKLSDACTASRAGPG